MSASHDQRLARLRERMSAEGVDAFVVTSPANVRYLSGFVGEGYVVVGKRDAVISTDGRYRVEAGEVADCGEALFHTGGHLAGAADGVRKFGAGAAAFESEHLTYQAYQSLAGKLSGVPLHPAERWVEELRVVKDEGEIALMRVACDKIDAALAAFLPGADPGKTECQLALELQMAMVELETEPAFATIMASGTSCARPHAVPCARVLCQAEMLKIDAGARWMGYCSDITRTYFFGKPDAKFHEIYNLVKTAQQAAVDAARPGLTGRELDAVARDIIVAAGYGDSFGHGLGHGVGLEVHEAPRVSSRSEDIMEPGMIVTIEPGIYIEGWGGVRIEDTVLITDDGCEALTHAPKGDY
ncbi:MAG: Xaa-Pro peptidase family protein [Armatimonadia bacterium]